IMQQHPNIKTITYSINAKQTSIVLGNNDKTIIGPGFIYDYLGDLKFRISSRSFYQVNPKQTERLYKVALEKADIKSSDKVLDTYCGIGTITLFASKLAKHVIGVESNPAAIGDAMFNQKINQITNVEFIKKDATVFMNQMAMKKELFDVLIMDPPRRGSTKSFIQAVGKLQPKKVLYISCNPNTLKQDLKEFKKVGYEYIEVIPVDMFPFTDHVECIVLLTKIEK
ncbi:MAG: 23S rRNA (uracil(1939)-C(5))-methyltransferase RlmD, partial [Erysipelotrichaceae bacterium]|nr:23S rRNA (uracil(1939)-C(5))-methyltransferase RlmD [Erysipelotrichaceae bacterium]